jgi:hypothetical protein
MGRFANELSESASHLGPVRKKPRDGKEHSEWDALGHPVPMHRRAAAMEHVREMCGDAPMDKGKVFSCIEAMCVYIERDNPHAAMERALGPEWGGHPEGIVDAIGVYRLLAVLLTAEKPKERPEERSKTDLVYDEWGF